MAESMAGKGAWGLSLLIRLTLEWEEVNKLM